ncbi:hypothetical protein AB0A63_31645 [Lentzea sp. NPDC042327]|uniref:hypothetical protein n=1 Tax=Lentzea sp. NPDC042327 TaxID=3154801 RepID=UPI0033D3F266
MTTDALTVTIRNLDETNPTVLYRHYQGELYVQSCHLELDLRDGELSADYDGEIGNAIPMSVHHGIVRRWGIPCVTAKSANELMRDIAPLAQRVLDGATIEWDGNNNVGVLTDDAADAEEEIIGRLQGDLDGLTLIGEMDAADWWAEGDLPEDLTADTTDKELEAIVEREEEDATVAGNDGYTVLVDADDYLTARREEMRDKVREELEEVAEQHGELENRRNDLIRRLTTFGDSSRYIGELAGLTHPAVLKIAKKKSVEQAD